MAKRYIAGVDIGNATTETALAELTSQGVVFVSEGTVKTTGVKGTLQNVRGVVSSLKAALDKVNATYDDIEFIALNEAAPVIGDVAMETITETIITESSMIGHNPDTPGGVGVGVGLSILLEDVLSGDRNQNYIVVVAKVHDFLHVAEVLNQAFGEGFHITGVIMQKDDGVLVSNRLTHKIPIVDEVLLIEKVPIGVLSAIEVASQGGVIEHLSNPYGIATVFGLSSDETKMIVPIARALIGNRSGVVLKTKQGDIEERIIPVGSIKFIGEKFTQDVDVDKGADAIMSVVGYCAPIKDIQGASGTHAGGMLERVRQTMATLTLTNPSQVKIQDLLAVDTFTPQKVQGGLAGEFSMENAVGIAAMVRADQLQMNALATEITKTLNISTCVGGVEADMAILGALTTPGSEKPLAVLDLGAGSSDASFSKNEDVLSIHLAGAGNMVTLIIDTELGLDNLSLAEDIKKYPLARVESMFHIRHENGTVEFFTEPLDATLFARVVILHESGMIPIPTRHSLEAIRIIRREAKEKVFVVNALRALKIVSPNQNIREVDHVILVGGSSLDFEIPQMISDALASYGIVAGRGNVRGRLGPRNAVASGLVLSYNETHKGALHGR